MVNEFFTPASAGGLFIGVWLTASLLRSPKLICIFLPVLVPWPGWSWFFHWFPITLVFFQSLLFALFLLFKWYINNRGSFKGKAILVAGLKELCYLIHSWYREVYTFPKVICSKVNTVTWQEFELAYDHVTGQKVSHYTKDAFLQAFENCFQCASYNWYHRHPKLLQRRLWWCNV